MKKKIIFKPRKVEKNPIKEKEKTELVNKCLVDIRKYYLNNIRDDKKLAFKVMHFNKVLKSSTPEKNFEFIDTFIKLEKWGFDDKN